MQQYKSSYLLLAFSCMLLILTATFYLKYSPHRRLLEMTFTAFNNSVLHSQNRNAARPLVVGRLETHCSKLFLGNTTDFTVRGLKKETSEEKMLQNTVNCNWVRDYFSNGLYTTRLEKSYPIAFTFLIHNNSQQVMRLLKLLYRPHNHYCIAPDLKSNATFINIFKNIAKCLHNIQMASKLIEVSRGHRSIMESQMQCYWDLLDVRKNQTEEKRWKYVINLCGKELPLNSNHEIVSYLMKLNGTSAIRARKIPPTERGTYRRLKNKSIPYSFPLYKSMTYMSLSYKFVHFLFTNETAIRLYKFFLTCEIPEEHFYATLYMVPNVPGGYDPRIPRSHYFTTDNYFWRHKEFIKKNGKQCSGIIVHNICIVSVGDLKRVFYASNYGKTALFHNKYFMEYDEVIMTCMEERIRAKNVLEYIEDV